jgi:ribosomal protein S17E
MYFPKIIPVKPPVMNVDTKPIENNIAGFNCKLIML